MTTRDRIRRLARNRVARGHASMIVATGLVATSFPVGAAITQGLDPVVLTFLRFALAAALFAPLVVWRYGIDLPRPMELMRYAVLSACLVGFFWGMFAALRETSPLNTASIFTLTPLIAALFSIGLLKEPLRRPVIVALGTGMLGALWIIFRGDWAALWLLDVNRGDALFLAATVAMGLYGPLVKRFHRGEPMARMTFWTLVTGAVWLFVLAAPKLDGIVWSAVPVPIYAGIAYLAVFTTLVTFFVMQWSTTVLGPTKSMSYIYLNPALVLLIGLMLGEGTPPLMVVPGFLLVFSAIYALQRVDARGVSTSSPGRLLRGAVRRRGRN